MIFLGYEVKHTSTNDAKINTSSIGAHLHLFYYENYNPRKLYMGSHQNRSLLSATAAILTRQHDAGRAADTHRHLARYIHPRPYQPQANHRTNRALPIPLLAHPRQIHRQ